MANLKVAFYKDRSEDLFFADLGEHLKTVDDLESLNACEATAARLKSNRFDVLNNLPESVDRYRNYNGQGWKLSKCVNRE